MCIRDRVYPGDSFQSHLKPFTEGAFRLDGPTGSVSAIMPYYTVSWERDINNGKNVGNEMCIRDRFYTARCASSRRR